LKVKLIANPIASRFSSRQLKKIENFLRHRASLDFSITSKKGDAETYARADKDSDLIIAVGGDGTINEIINGIAERETPLAILPMGMSDVLATELKIPVDIEKALNIALTKPPRKVSLGMINGRYFAAMVGIGFDAEAVFHVNPKTKPIFCEGAYILSGLKVLLKYKPPLMHIKANNELLHGYNAFIGNASCYAKYFKVTPEASLLSPSLDLCLLMSGGRSNLLRFVAGVITQRHTKFKDVYCAKYNELEIFSENVVHIQVDGDYFGTLPARINIVPDALNLIW